MLSFFFRLLFRLFLVAVAVATILFFSWDWIVKKVAEHRIQNVTGLETHIGTFYVGVKSPVIRIENFRLYNAPEFGGAPLVDFPEIYLEYDAAALAAGKAHLKLLRVNLAEATLARNAAGQTNINILRDRLAALPPLPPTKNGANGDTNAPAKRGIAFDRIDTLDLTLGKLRYTDLQTPANSREADLGIHGQIFQNIKSQEELYGAALVLFIKCGPELSEAFTSQLPGGGADKIKQATDKIRSLLK